MHADFGLDVINKIRSQLHCASDTCGIQTQALQPTCCCVQIDHYFPHAHTLATDARIDNVPCRSQYASYIPVRTLPTCVYVCFIAGDEENKFVEAGSFVPKYPSSGWKGGLRSEIPLFENQCTHNHEES